MMPICVLIYGRQILCSSTQYQDTPPCPGVWILWEYKKAFSIALPLAYNHSGFEANENSSDYGLGFNYGRLIGRDMASFAKWTAECLPGHHSFYPLSFHDVHLRRLRGKSFETTCRTQTSPDNWQCPSNAKSTANWDHAEVASGVWDNAHYTIWPAAGYQC